MALDRSEKAIHVGTQISLELRLDPGIASP